MERLTVEYCGEYVPKAMCSIDRFGGADDCDLCCDYCKATEDGNEDCRGCAINECFKKLGEYEDLEEQNCLLKLPCAVGDTVYADSGMFGILEYTVDNIIVNKTITFLCSAYSEPIGDCLDEIEPDISEFGKTVFLTPEEAEAALKELMERKCMSGDLISRKAVLEIIKKHECDTAKIATGIIDIPTTFDVDKAFEQVKSEICELVCDYDCANTTCADCKAEKVLEIIKFALNQ